MVIVVAVEALLVVIIEVVVDAIVKSTIYVLT